MKKLFVVVPLLLLSFASCDQNENIAKRLQSKEVIKKAYQLMAEKNYGELKKIVADNVLWEFEGPKDRIPFASKYYGKSGIDKFFKTYNSYINDIKVTPYGCVIDNDRVDVFLFEEGSLKSSGKSFYSHTIHLWQIDKKGKISKFTSVNDTYNMYKAFDENVKKNKYEIFDYDDSAQYFQQILGKNKNESEAYSKGQVLNVYKSFKQRDIKTLLGLLADDVEWIAPGQVGILPLSGPHKGKTGIIELVQHMAKVHTIKKMDITGIIVDGNRVDVKLHEEGIVNATGKKYNLNIIHAWELDKEGKISKVTSFHDLYSLAQSYNIK